MGVSCHLNLNVKVLQEIYIYIYIYNVCTAQNLPIDCCIFIISSWRHG